MFQGSCPIVKTDKLNEYCYEIHFFAPQIAKEAKPGQFVNILCGEKTLRRPISICELNAETGVLRIVFEVRGEGTQWLSRLSAGGSIDVLGPLGNGFPCFNSGKILLVGGGIGVPPLLGVSKAAGDCDAVLGFRDSAHVCLEKDFESTCGKVCLMTDDGSAGEKGFVTARAEKLLSGGEYKAVLACGPMPMLKALSALARETATPCFVSLEERMGCGIGACLACACAIKTADGEKYLHVCKDGPVFNSEEVVF